MKIQSEEGIQWWLQNRICAHAAYILRKRKMLSVFWIRGSFHEMMEIALKTAVRSMNS